MVRKIKSITGRAVFLQAPEVKKQLWGGEFWSDGYYLSTVGRSGSEKVIFNYVKQQGREQEYTQLHKDQLTLFF
jgi:REP element-mobilizing transposase RayT